MWSLAILRNSGSHVLAIAICFRFLVDEGLDLAATLLTSRGQENHERIPRMPTKIIDIGGDLVAALSAWKGAAASVGMGADLDPPQRAHALITTRSADSLPDRVGRRGRRGRCRKSRRLPTKRRWR